jgi:hypothetical protein
LGKVKKPEIGDLLCDTLAQVALIEQVWDVMSIVATQAERPIVDIFNAEVADFSKYKLVKAFLRWARTHEAADLAEVECSQWMALIDAISKDLV